MITEQLRELVRAGSLFARDRPVVVMLSGGRDSTCLLDVAVALLGGASVSALHVNYGLRESSDADAVHCAALCEQLGVELEVVRTERAAVRRPLSAPLEAVSSAHEQAPPPPSGNLQAWAREVRYREATRMADTLDAAATPGAADALIATGHTASDQVETVLYRLAASPGRRALLGMAPREGRLVRPLLELTRAQTATYCRARGLSWCEDASNDDERYARARVRHAVVPALRAVHPAAEANVLRTAERLRAEAELLDELVDAELAGAAAQTGAGTIAVERLRGLPDALQRLVVVRLAEDAAGTFVPQAGARVAEILALAERGGRAELHVGGLVGAVVERGRLSMVRLPPRG
jgi:tRNA(Ile)-lysidine synthase